MEYWKPITTLPDGLVLNWWAAEPAGTDYRHVASMARLHGVKASVAQARRDVRRRLYRLQLLPTHRPATTEDFADAKVAWLHRWRDEDGFLV